MLPRLCSLQVSLQGISCVTQVLLAHHAHEGDEDLEHPLRRHLEFMIDPRAGAFRSKDKAMPAGEELKAGDDPDAFVALEFAQFLLDLPETPDLELESRAVADLPG